MPTSSSSLSRAPVPWPLSTPTPLPPTYYNREVKEKWNPSSLLHPGLSRSLLDDVNRRDRGTAGGDRLPSSCPPSTDVASLTTVNIALNSVVSEDTFFGTADLTDFYFGTPVNLPLSQRQFIRIDIDSYSPAVLARLTLLPFIRTARNGKRFVIFRIDQTMYGLRDAGKLSNLRLVSLLSASGFIEIATPCLFRHVSRSISFVLVVDDFGIKTSTKIATTTTISSLAFPASTSSNPTPSPPRSWGFLSLTIAPSASSLSLTQAISTPCCTAYAHTGSSQPHPRSSITLPSTARRRPNTPPPIPPRPLPPPKRRSWR
jgi:hypothetical protein